MKRDDLDDIAALWRAEPSSDERRELEQLADRTSRRARLFQSADLGLGAMLMLAAVIAMSMSPAPATIAIGVLSVTALAWSSWKRHLLGQVALMMETSDRAMLVDTAMLRVEANLRRSTIGLVLLPFSLLLGAMLSHSVREAGSLASFLKTTLDGATGMPGVAVLAGLALALAHLVRTNLLLRRELAELQGLHDEYQEEARLDSLALG